MEAQSIVHLQNVNPFSSFRFRFTFLKLQPCELLNRDLKLVKWCGYPAALFLVFLFLKEGFSRL